MSARTSVSSRSSRSARARLVPRSTARARATRTARANHRPRATLKEPMTVAAAKKKVSKAERLERKREQASQIYEGLVRRHPDAHCELDHRSPFELVIATVLSAQSTDVMVNKVTPELFRRWPDP